MRCIPVNLAATFALLLPCVLWAGGTVRANPPSECKAPDSACGCSAEGDDGSSDDGAVWLLSTNAASCSDASVAPLVTSTVQQLTGLAAATPARSCAADLRGNVTESTLRFDAPFSVFVQTPPFATNEQVSVSRYGVDLQTVSVSFVTNTFAYDALGRSVAHTDGRGNTTCTEFNAAGQQTAIIDALGNRTEYAYDGLGNLASVTDPLAYTVFTVYDAKSRIVAQCGAIHPVIYEYDEFGHLTAMGTTRDETVDFATISAQIAGNVSILSFVPLWSLDITRWLRDEATGLVTNKVYADGKGPTYDYTPNGRLSRRIWARGIVTDYAYDAWGNLTNTVYSDDTPTVSLYHDAMGRQIEARDAAGTTTFAYDAYGVLTNETVIGIAGTNTIERYWDDFGRPTGYTLNPDNPVNPVQNICYSYDGLGHFASVDFNAEAQSGRVEYGYLPGTDIVSGYTSGDFSRIVAYEPQRDLIATVTNAFGSALISAFDYANDAAGRRVSRRDTFDGATTTNAFGYNARSEVTSAIMGTNSYGYAYDSIGNRLTASDNTATNTYTANSLNQYTAIDDFAPTYDDDGNTTADERFTYFWNGENRLVCASNDEVVVTYAYDHRGRMVRKNISHGGAEPQSIAYLWDDWNIIREIQGSGVRDQGSGENLVTDNVWGLDLDGTLQGAGGAGGLLAVVRADCTATNLQLTTHNSQLFLPAYDANGNVTEYVATNCETVAHYEYSPFGEPIVASGEMASSLTHQFSTKPYCAVTGFSEYQMRKYQAEIGRWMSRDPMEDFRFHNQHYSSLRLKTYWNHDGENTKFERDYRLGVHVASEIEKNTILKHKGSKGIASADHAFLRDLYVSSFNSLPNAVDFLGLKVQVCIRPLTKLPNFWGAVHCFIKTETCGNWNFGKGKGVAPELHPGGVGLFPAWCVELDCVKDECKLCADIKNSMQVWPQERYDFLCRNCCHWVNERLKRIGCRKVSSYFPGYILPYCPF